MHEGGCEEEREQEANLGGGEKERVKYVRVDFEGRSVRCGRRCY